MIDYEIKKYIHCTLESERSLSWTNIDIYCDENGGKWWRSDGAVFTEQSQYEGAAIIKPGQLGTGTSITTKYLRGDGTWQTIAGGGDLLAANNLSDVASAATSRTNLGLGTLATQSGTFSGTSSGTNTGDETTSTLGATINGAAAAVPNDTDLVATVDTSVVKKITWTNVKAFLKTYFDTIYNPIATGTPDGTKFLRDDNTWQAVSGGSGLTQPQVMARISMGF